MILCENGDVFILRRTGSSVAYVFNITSVVRGLFYGHTSLQYDDFSAISGDTFIIKLTFELVAYT